MNDQGMLIVTNVEYVSVPSERWYFEKLSNPMDLRPHVSMPTKNTDGRNGGMIDVDRELIQGQRFARRSSNGVGDFDVVIGWTKDVQNLLRTPFYAFDEMSEQLASLSKERSKQYEQIRILEGVIKRYEENTIEHKVNKLKAILSTVNPIEWQSLIIFSSCLMFTLLILARF